MIAKIEKTDSDGIKSVFTIAGSTRNEIDFYVDELTQWSMDYSESYSVLDYGDGEDIF